MLIDLTLNVYPSFGPVSNRITGSLMQILMLLTLNQFLCERVSPLCTQLCVYLRACLLLSVHVHVYIWISNMYF